jgi:hypothetical protein
MQFIGKAEKQMGDTGQIQKEMLLKVVIVGYYKSIALFMSRK